MIHRKTIQRSLVLAAVNRLQNHATADEIYEDIAKEHPTVSWGTVYRNLKQLSDAVEIRKLEVPGGVDRYDYLCHNHYHTRCLKCGRVFDVDMDYIDNLAAAIRDTLGFEISGHDIMFKSVCQDCSR